ncbi:hypothetical protein FRC01_001843, partial [Tulasnella sp. 417]
LGAFLVRVPPDVPIDHAVMQDYNTLLSATPASDYVQNGRATAPKLRPVSPSTPKSSKKKRVPAVVSLAPQSTSTRIESESTSLTAQCSPLRYEE